MKRFIFYTKHFWHTTGFGRLGSKDAFCHKCGKSTIPISLTINDLEDEILMLDDREQVLMDSSIEWKEMLDEALERGEGILEDVDMLISKLYEIENQVTYIEKQLVNTKKESRRVTKKSVSIKNKVARYKNTEVRKAKRNGDLMPFHDMKLSSLIESFRGEGRHGLISFNADGSVRKSSFSETDTPHEDFIDMGWVFYEGSGYYDEERNIAQAYFEGRFVNYPEWHKK